MPEVPPALPLSTTALRGQLLTQGPVVLKLFFGCLDLCSFMFSLAFIVFPIVSHYVRCMRCNFLVFLLFLKLFTARPAVSSTRPMD